MLRRFLGGLMLAVAGCAGSPAAPAQSPAPEPPPPPPPLTQERIHALIGEVALLRQLPQRAPVQIHLLDEPAFIAALRERERQLSKAEADGRMAFLSAFDLVPDVGIAEGRPSSAREVMEEQVLAFYDRERRHIVARAARPRTKAEADKQLGVLAHEIEHALQDQHFGRPAPEEISEEDSRLAYGAVLEGDAMVTMVAYVAADRGLPFSRAIRRVSDITRDVQIDRIVAGERGSALAHALPIMRERLMFPYNAGAGLVADLYRAGGLSLVNTLFTRRPVSTEQVLHPEKYIAGEMPVAVRAPAPPPGYRLVASEPLGELQTRVVLERCIYQAGAAAAAAGWGGDRYSLFTGPAGEVALLWSTAWDTENDAAEFSRALSANPACLRSPRMGSAKIDGSLHVVTEGRNVAVVRGLPDPLARETAKGLLALPAEAVMGSPVGNYQIPPRYPLPSGEKGVVYDGVYASRWLGIAAQLPFGFSSGIGRGPLELKVGVDGMPVNGALMLSDRMTTPRFVEEVFRDVARGFSESAGGKPLISEGGGPVMLPLGPAVERWWSVADSPVSLRAVVLPVCNGTGSYIFLQTWTEPTAKTLLDGWLGSFRWTSGGSPPVCWMLDPR
ncbi:hypothetical protein [Polyangium aurulentum]|uniref:hypothetical protein n=1 Tax=Polyangium aurulentum TaxID=2567896 RepID=UPI0010AE2B80|nr:hypothetical protein [Polyangium aurulentum]UQA57851.1 hypothetical protein E8A73_042335 [Polyangium aurulentum]